ncbi:MAG: DUF1801 domain-containing protein [Candidatus Nanopelagicales bacterium]|nr:DUF1801 domain-containing protein [Candidatus Nanopelagicales bacterium]
MSTQEIDDYIAQLDEPQRSSLETLRARILAVIPDAEQCISYRLPAFRVDGKVLAGFAANKGDLSYYPHSGSVLGQFPDELAGYQQTPGALRFPSDQPLSRALVKRLIVAKWHIAFGDEVPFRGAGGRRGSGAATGLSGEALWREAGLGAPARRALVQAGILTIADLKGRDRADIAALHGIGPNALAKLAELMS